MGKAMILSVLTYLVVGAYAWFFGDSLIFLPPDSSYEDSADVIYIDNGKMVMHRPAYIVFHYHFIIGFQEPAIPCPRQRICIGKQFKLTVRVFQVVTGNNVILSDTDIPGNNGQRRQPRT